MLKVAVVVVVLETVVFFYVAAAAAAAGIAVAVVCFCHANQLDILKSVVQVSFVCSA